MGLAPEDRDLSDELVLTYLRERHEEWLGLYRTRVEQASSPRERVLAVFDAYLDHAEFTYQQHGFRGCGLLNAAAELPIGAPGRDLVRRHKEEVESLLVRHLAELGAAPNQSAAVGEQLAFLLEGAMARAGLEGDATRLRRARSLAGALVDSLPLGTPTSDPSS